MTKDVEVTALSQSLATIVNRKLKKSLEGWSVNTKP